MWRPFALRRFLGWPHHCAVLRVLHPSTPPHYNKTGRLQLPRRQASCCYLRLLRVREFCRRIPGCLDVCRGIPSRDAAPEHGHVVFALLTWGFPVGRQCERLLCDNLVAWSSAMDGQRSPSQDALSGALALQITTEPAHPQNSPWPGAIAADVSHVGGVRSSV